MRCYHQWFKTSLLAFLAGFIVSGSAPALALDLKVWKASTNPETKERYIPVELWSGAEWDGKQELKMPKVDASYTHSELGRTERYWVFSMLRWKSEMHGQFMGRRKVMILPPP